MVGRWGGRRVVLAATAVLLVVGGTITLHVLDRGLHIARVPGAFRSLENDDARPAADSTETFLVVSADSGAGETCEVLMLARVDPARTAAAVVAIPRDSWVPIPGRDPATIATAYATGGPALLIRTVEQLTAVRVDHFAVIDFARTEELVDAVGGIDVSVAAATGQDGVRFRQGANRLDGAAALAYVRQRDDLPQAALDHAVRQQSVLRALLTRAGALQLLADPLRIYRLLGALSRAVRVDESLDSGWIVELRGLQADGVTFLGAPVLATDGPQDGPQDGPRSVVHLDEQRAAGLWQALRVDAAPGYAKLNPGDSLGAAPP